MKNKVGKKGKVYLVGMGPGNPQLSTLAVVNCIQKAEVIIYDHLMSTELLRHKSAGCELIYAGKSPDQHSMKQDEISRLLVKKAKENKIVARLKGGDPFLFGRGSEEACALAQEKIPFEIVPGVSSGIAAAAYAGVPLTHRGIASSVTFVTGHEDPGKTGSSVDWGKLAAINGTLVVFMGMSRLELIIKDLLGHGKDKRTPVCVVQWGTLPKQRSVTGRLENIAAIVKAQGITNPAIVIIGEVVKLKKILNWFETKPLFGKKILITRPEALTREFSLILEEQGAQAVSYPLIEIRRIKGLDEDKVLKKLRANDWIVFTSRNAVEICFDILAKAGKDIRFFGQAKIAALGSQTSEDLKKRGIIPDLVPKNFVMESLLRDLKKQGIRGKKVFLPHSYQARPLLAKGLISAGAVLDEVFIYDAVMPRKVRQTNFRKMIEAENFDLITFTSSSGVRQFMRLMKRSRALLRKQKFAVIGPITEKTLAGYGFKACLAAKNFTAPGLAQVICAYFKKRKK